jgi:hypothetical protein
VVDVVTAGDVGCRIAPVAPSDRLAPLVVGELRFSAELHAARLGSLPAFAGPHTYEVALNSSRPGDSR